MFLIPPLILLLLMLPDLTKLHFPSLSELCFAATRDSKMTYSFLYLLLPGLLLFSNEATDPLLLPPPTPFAPGSSSLSLHIMLLPVRPMSILIHTKAFLFAEIIFHNLCRTFMPGPEQTSLLLTD